MQQLWCTDGPRCRLQIWTLPGIQQSNLVFQKTLQGSACHLCSYVAPTGAALRMHLKKHKKCSHCSYTSRGVPDIKKHYRDNHRELLGSDIVLKESSNTIQFKQLAITGGEKATHCLYKKHCVYCTVHYKEYKHIYHLRGFQFFVKVKFCDLKKIVSFIFTYCILGWRDFGNFFYTLYVVPNCCWTPIPEFHVLMLPLSLVTRPLKIWTLTLKWTTTKKTLWRLQQGGNVFFDFFKS